MNLLIKNLKILNHIMSNRSRHKKSSQHLIVQILGQKIANRMMQCQREQSNAPNLDVFLKDPTADKRSDGFYWAETSEGSDFWDAVLNDRLTTHYLYKKWKNDRR